MPVTFKHRVLANGLQVVAEVDPRAHSAAAGFFVKTGARDEATPLMGVSHFLEHMMFKGTEDISAEQLNRGFDEIGARNNAYTSGELTCFYAHLIPERMTAGLDLLSRMMRPALRRDDFDREKKVILEEIAMYKDDPFWVLYEESLERHYGRHPMGHRVLGTADSITALTREQMLAYFDERYSADNTAVAFAGRIDFDAACDQVNRLCGSWRATRVGRDNSRPAVGGGSFELKDERIDRAYLIGLAPGPARDDPRRYAALLLAQVLGAPDNSRLHWALIETGIAEQAQAAFDAHDGCGDFYVFASGDPARAEQIWSVLQAEAEHAADHATDDDLLRLRSKLATGVTVGGERPADRMQRLGQLWTYLGRYRSLEEELEQINRVRLDDLRAVARDFPLTPVTAGRLLPA